MRSTLNALVLTVEEAEKGQVEQQESQDQNARSRRRQLPATVEELFSQQVSKCSMFLADPKKRQIRLNTRVEIAVPDIQN